MAWIKVERAEYKPAPFRVFCKRCGHDAFSRTFDEAIARAHAMRVDHLPYSPDGEVSCWGWYLDHEMSAK